MQKVKIIDIEVRKQAFVDDFGDEIYKKSFKVTLKRLVFPFIYKTETWYSDYFADNHSISYSDWIRSDGYAEFFPMLDVSNAVKAHFLK